MEVTESLLDKHYVGKDLTDLGDNGQMRPISRITLIIDDDNYVTAGNDSGVELQADCPYATQNMADTLLDSLRGYQYQMYSAEAVNIDPAAELGDGVTVGNMYSIIARIDDGGVGYPSISAPGESELQDEYPVIGPTTQEFKRRIEAVKKWAEENDQDLKQAIANATDWIVNGEKGEMIAVQKDGKWTEIASLDTGDIRTAKSVWRWNNGGFGHSSNGYDGPYTLALTADGAINASLITTGVLIANIIKAGVLASSNGKTSINMETGDCNMTGIYTSEWISESGKRARITINPDGITFELGGWHKGSFYLGQNDETTVNANSFVLHYKNAASGETGKVFAQVTDDDKTIIAVDELQASTAHTGIIYTDNAEIGELSNHSDKIWVNGQAASWKTMTIGDQTITYLGQ